MGQIHCGAQDSLNKIPFVYPEEPVLRSELKYKCNPFKMKRKIVYMSKSKTFNDSEIQNRRQVLMGMKIRLIEPNSLEFNVKLKKKSIGSNEFEFEDIKVEMSYLKGFNMDFDCNKEDVIRWAGVEESLMKKENTDVITKFYGQNYKSIPTLAKHGPYRVLNDDLKKVYVDRENLFEFKKHIEEKLNDKLKYYYLQDTEITIHDDVQRFNIIFEFEFFNLKGLRLKNEYGKYKMSLPE